MKTTKITTMKTAYILAAFLGLQSSMMFAAPNFSELPNFPKEFIPDVSSAMLAPATPAEATFEDVAEMNSDMVKIQDLAPATPAYAEFEEPV